MKSCFSRRGFLQHAAAGTALTPVAAFASAGFAWAADDSTSKFQPPLAICNETFRDWPFDRAFGFAAECGYRGIEVAPFTISDYVTDISAAKRTEVRKQAEKAGVEIIGLHWLLARTKGIHLTSPDRDVRRKTAEYLGELARFVADLGGSRLIFGSPQQRNLLPGVNRQQALKYAAEVVDEALPMLEKHDALLAFEPLSPKTTTFLRTAAEAVELIELVDSPRCKLILDCNAMATESTAIPDLIRQHHQRLAHFHANDPNRMGPGFGELDFVPVFSALRDVKYSGWVSVEVFNYSPGPERLARESIQYMQKVLRQVNA